MIRIFSRIAAVAVILSLSLLAASPAQAAPLGGSQWISKMPARWADATLSLLSSFFPGTTQAPAQRMTEKTKPTKPSDGGSGGWTVTPQTGSCIDPLGNPCTVDPDP